LWLVLICYERKVLLAGGRLAGADLIREKSTASWLANKPSEHNSLNAKDKSQWYEKNRE